MKAVTATDVRIFLQQHLSRDAVLDGQTRFGELSDDCDLMLSGMIDSIGLLQLVGAIQEFVGKEIDFDGLDPEQMTVVGPLCKFVSQQANQNA